MQGLVLVLRPGAAVAIVAAAAAFAISAGAPAGAAAQSPDYQVPQVQYLTPFPVVRLAGETTRAGVRITLLRIRSPRGSSVTVRCSGGRKLGCPYRRASRTSPKSSLLRFRSLERRLKGGARIVVVVSRGQTIGKYTSFTIRKRRAPSRTDACVLPGDPFEPAECP